MGKMTLDPAAQSYADLAELDAIASAKLNGIDGAAKNIAVISDWVLSTAYILGDEVKPSTPNDYRYVCTLAGSSDATEPVWGTVEGGITTDGTVEWTAWKWEDASVNADVLVDGVDNKVFSATEDTKLGGIAEGAEVNPADLAALDSAQDTKLNAIEAGAEVNQGDDVIVGQINTATVPITREAALDQVPLKLVKSEPVTGEHRINYLVRKSDGKMEADFEDVAES